MNESELEAKRNELALKLPSNWAYHRDLLLILGDCQGKLVAEWRELGQEHIIILLPPENYGPEDLPDGVIVAYPDSLSLVVQSIGSGPIKHVWMVSAPNWNIAAGEKQKVRHTVTMALRSRLMNYTTMKEFGKAWLLQGMANLPSLVRSRGVRILQDKFKGRPAVLVAPGPSLSQHLELLAACKDRAVVIAGSHSLHALQAAGVQVDIAIAIDAGDAVERHFEGIDTEKIGALLFSLVVSEKLMSLPYQTRFFVSVNGPLDAWAFEQLGDSAAISSGGSVACTALSLARVLGCDPIVLVGQDLSFPGGKIYAEETLDGNAEVVETDGKFMLRKPVGASGPGPKMEDGSLRFSQDQQSSTLPGYYGGTVHTSVRLEQFHAWFEAAGVREGRHARFVNSTEGGALIKSMESIPFAEMVAGFDEEFDVQEVLREYNAVDLEERTASCSAYLSNVKHALDESTLIAERCRRLSDRARTNERALEQLGQLEAQLKGALSPVSFFTMFAHEALDGAKEQARSAESLDENLDAVAKIMDVVIEAAELLRQPLEVVGESLEGA